MHEVVALREAHDDVAAMRAERHAHEAGGLRKKDVVELLLELVREQLGKLVLEPLALLVRERQIARVGTDAQHLGIDQLEREVAGLVGLRNGDVAERAGRHQDPQ